MAGRDTNGSSDAFNGLSADENLDMVLKLEYFLV